MDGGGGDLGVGTFGADAHFVLGVVFEEPFDTTAGELVRGGWLADGSVKFRDFFCATDEEVEMARHLRRVVLMDRESCFFAMSNASCDDGSLLTKPFSSYPCCPYCCDQSFSRDASRLFLSPALNHATDHRQTSSSRNKE